MVIASKPICESRGAWELPSGTPCSLQLAREICRCAQASHGKAPWHGSQRCCDLISEMRSNAMNVVFFLFWEVGSSCRPGCCALPACRDSPESQREPGPAPCSGGKNHWLSSLPPVQPAIVETTFFQLNSAEACPETFRDEGADYVTLQAEAEELITCPHGAERVWQSTGRLFAPKACGARRFSASLNARSDGDVANVTY